MTDILSEYAEYSQNKTEKVAILWDYLKVELTTVSNGLFLGTNLQILQLSHRGRNQQKKIVGIIQNDSVLELGIVRSDVFLGTNLPILQ